MARKKILQQALCSIVTLSKRQGDHLGDQFLSGPRQIQKSIYQKQNKLGHIASLEKSELLSYMSGESLDAKN